MLLHLPIVILAAFSPVAVSDAVPKFDIVRECRFEGGSIVELGRCSDDEGAALQELQRAWAQFADADKRNCLVATTIGGFASYVELLTCLEMAREANDTDKDPRGPKNADPMRPIDPGLTVGVGDKFRDEALVELSMRSRVRSIAHTSRKIGIDQLEPVEPHVVCVGRGVAELNQDRPPQFCG